MKFIILLKCVFCISSNFAKTLIFIAKMVQITHHLWKLLDKEMSMSLMHFYAMYR